jgi:hypothetical protein
MAAGCYACPAVNTFRRVKFHQLSSRQCFCWAGFYAAIAALSSTTATSAFAVFPAAFLIINLYRHNTAWFAIVYIIYEKKSLLNSKFLL